MSIFTPIYALISIPFKLFKWFNDTFLMMDISKKGAVFVTGCDTGFGYLLALKLVQNGVDTFAGCLTESGESELRKAAGQAPGKLWTLHLDVTDQSTVDDALEYVKLRLGPGKGLWGLVNNAGIVRCPVPDDWLTVGDYEKEMGVNFFGVVRVTQAFKSLLKLQRGRLVVVTSIFGRFASPGAGPYCASKFAAEAYCDIVRRELKHFGVSVHILEPGFFATNITNVDATVGMVKELWERQPASVKEEYGEEYFEKAIAGYRKNLPRCCNTRLHLVVDAYYDALASVCPRMRYWVGADAVLVFLPLSLLPTFLQDFIVTAFFKYNALKPKAVA